jgi:hypothetical protein
MDWVLIFCYFFKNLPGLKKLRAYCCYLTDSLTKATHFLTSRNKKKIKHYFLKTQNLLKMLMYHINQYSIIIFQTNIKEVDFLIDIDSPV